jgi:hypothetical protein
LSVLLRAWRRGKPRITAVLARIEPSPLGSDSIFVGVVAG